MSHSPSEIKFADLLLNNFLLYYFLILKQLCYFFQDTLMKRKLKKRTAFILNKIILQYYHFTFTSEFFSTHLLSLHGEKINCTFFKMYPFVILESHTAFESKWEWVNNDFQKQPHFQLEENTATIEANHTINITQKGCWQLSPLPQLFHKQRLLRSDHRWLTRQPTQKVDMCHTFRLSWVFRPVCHSLVVTTLKALGPLVQVFGRAASS